MGLSTKTSEKGDGDENVLYFKQLMLDPVFLETGGQTNLVPCMTSRRNQEISKIREFTQTTHHVLMF